MGTRHLTAVQYKNKIKVAQYGQWDGYPSGQGVIVLDFLKDKKLVNALKDKFDKDIISFYTEEEVKKFNKLLDANDKKALTLYNNYNHRDIGAEILSVLANSTDEKIKLCDDFEFGSDSLFCEYAYLVNFDTGFLEVYAGFNKSGDCNVLTKRFYTGKNNNGYYGCILAIKFPIDNLPSKKVFVDKCIKACDEVFSAK